MATMSDVNSDARGAFDPFPRAQSVEGSGSPVSGGVVSAARSPIWRTAVHEAGHILCEKNLGFEVSGSTVAEGPGYSGMTWGPESLRAKRGKAACDDLGNDAFDAVAVRVAENISQYMPGPGEFRDGVHDIFSTVQGRVIGMMGGGAAEMAILGDSPPRFIESDVYSANAIAGIVCRTDASRSSFIEHCYQEALALIEANKSVVLALAQALIDHPERTLNSAEIDQTIAAALAPKSIEDERQRRATWKRVEQSAASFAGMGVKRTWPNWAGMSQFDPDGPIRVAQPSSCFDKPPE
jgi:hypothetical protein